MSTVRQARGCVLVAGGGFAGGYLARLLSRVGATIVSPENFMLYTQPYGYRCSARSRRSAASAESQTSSA